MDTTHSFGYWVRRQRKALDLTQRELAERAACSLSAIKKIEQDTRRPSRQLAEILADYLAIPELERESFLNSARGLGPVDALPLASRPLASADDSDGQTNPAAVGNLPAEVTPIFGREAELSRLFDLINTVDARLITLTGPGGVGKSRLALETARTTQAQFRDGAWFVPLAGVSDTADLSAAIAIAQGLSFAGPLGPEQQLIRQMQGRQLLLLLDNFEQLLPDGAELIASLILNLPALRILVTSRERLRLRGEIPVAVDGMDPKSARHLFADRVRRADINLPHEKIREAAGTIGEICRVVGGLPLAIELAAAWARLLSPTEILSELGNSLVLLASDLHDLPARHRNMAAVFEGSWARLAADEQKLLARLSIFAGSFTRNAAESICGATLSQMARLHDQSLLQRDRERFHLHELIRQFAAKKLESLPDELALVKGRHASYYIDLLSHLSDLFKIGGPQLTGWEHVIEGEMDNIRIAWRWAIANNQPQRLLPATLALGEYYSLTGQMRAGTQMFTALIDSAAEALAESSMDDPLLRRTQAHALSMQGYISLQMGRFTLGQEQLRQAESLLEGLDAPAERLGATALLGAITMMTKGYDAGRQTLTDVLRLARSEDHIYGQALALNFLGLIHLTHDQPERARESLTEAIAIWSQHPGLAFCELRSMVHLGLTYHALGDYEKAVRIQEKALQLAEETQDNGFIPLSHCNLAFHHYAQGNLTLAHRGFQIGLSKSRQLDIMTFVWHGILGLGLVAAAEGQRDRAVTLLTYGTARRGPGPNFLLGEPQRVLASLRAELSPAEFAAAEDRALEMELDDLLRWL